MAVTAVTVFDCSLALKATIDFRDQMFPFSCSDVWD